MKVLLLSHNTSIHTKRWQKALEQRGYVVKVVDGSRKFGLAPAMLVTWLKAFMSLITFRPDIVHAHYLTSYGVVAAFLPTRHLITTLWGSDVLVTATTNAVAKTLSRFALWRSKAVFADAPILIDVADSISRCRDKCVLVHWGVDPVFHMEQARKDKDIFNFLSIRNHENVYNIDLIIRAFHALFADNRKAVLTIAGGGSLTEELKKTVEDLRIADQVRFTGMLNEKMLAHEIQSAHIVVTVPSSDGTAMSILESIACGTYILCSELRANRDFLGTDAKYCEPGSLDSLLGAMQQLYSLGTGKVSELGNEVHERLAAKVERKSQFDLVEKYYSKILST